MKPLSTILHPNYARLPMWMKLAMAALLAMLIPVYWYHYGPSNFLWFSDIALFFAAVTLWTGRRMFACTAATLSLVPEIGWNADFFIGITTGWFPMGLAAYMTEQDRAPILRILSLFHVPLPVLLIYLVHKLGYDRRAHRWAIGISTVVLIVTYLVTTPGDTNINWVYGPGGDEPQAWMHPWLWLAMLIVALPLVVFLPTHLLLSWWRGGPG